MKCRISILPLFAITSLIGAMPAAAGQDSDLQEYALTTLHIKTFTWAEYDLNADGRLEQFLYARDPEWCGSGGCTLFVLEKQNQGYRVVLRSSITQSPVGVLPEITKGWHDVAVGCGGGGISRHMTRLRFNGMRYASNPTLAPPLAKNFRFKSLIPK